MVMCPWGKSRELKIRPYFTIQGVQRLQSQKTLSAAIHSTGNATSVKLDTVQIQFLCGFTEKNPLCVVNLYN